jgi:hypothetical protein
MVEIPKYVRTSMGIRLASQVVAVRGGSRVSRPRNGGRVHAEAAQNSPEQTQVAVASSGGWISWGSWESAAADPIVSFVASWTVPPAPSQGNGQLVYLFNALQDGAGAHILQPVLQWGLSPALNSGPYWGLASFWVGGTNDPTFCSEFVPVSPGATVTGRMEVSVQQNGLYSCSCRFDGFPGTQLTAENLPALVGASVTLEAYDIGPDAPYPAISGTNFSGIAVELDSGPPVLDWAKSGGATVLPDGAVEVVYPVAATS